MRKNWDLKLISLVEVMRVMTADLPALTASTAKIQVVGLVGPPLESSAHSHMRFARPV